MDEIAFEWLQDFEHFSRHNLREWWLLFMDNHTTHLTSSLNSVKTGASGHFDFLRILRIFYNCLMECLFNNINIFMEEWLTRLLALWL
jgi:hypothetical protein